MKRTVGIVGGGAAGMMAAVTAARQGAEVTILEGNDRVGRKLLSTGNGKCNLGNRRLGLEEYYTEQPGRLRECLERFGTEDTVSFFQGIGLLVKEKNGYLYPACEQASAVLDVLRYELAALNVKVITGCKVKEVRPGRRGGQIAVRSVEQTFCFDRVVIACGGRAAPRTGSDGSGYRLAEQLGHTLLPTVPALVQLRCSEPYMKALSGVRAEALLRVWQGGECVASERGELQLTDYGISGIPVFQLSRQVNYILQRQREVEVTVDFLPDYWVDECEALQAGSCGQGKLAPGCGMGECEALRTTGSCGRGRPSSGCGMGECEALQAGSCGQGKLAPDCGMGAYEALQAGRELLCSGRTVEEFFTGMLHKKLMLQFIKMAGLRPGEPAESADKGALRRVYELCRQWRVHVNGHNSYDNAQVCAGGVPLDQVSENLESDRAAGVFFAGEILDVDGKCGGYNLQWAWCSGYLAGKAAAIG